MVYKKRLMINNFEAIRKLLVFETPDDFYFAQIIKRKKEHPELGNNSLIVKTYYIKSLEHLDILIPEMIAFCDYHNARMGINLNRRSFEKIAFQTLRKITDQLMNKDFKSVKSAYDSACGAYSNETNKTWIIDVDEAFNDEQYYEMIDSLADFQPLGSKVLACLPTKNGYHVITKPFNMIQFTSVDAIKMHDIHKDNPTIMYIP